MRRREFCRSAIAAGIAAAIPVNASRAMIAGELPFRGSGAGMLMSKINKSYLPVTVLAADLPEGIDAVMAWGLDPDPKKRCPTAARFAKAISDLLPVTAA